MNDLIVWRDKLQELYAMKSIYIDKAVQFVLALVTFLMINQNIGLMKAVATPVVAVALAVICTFLPPVVTAYVAAGLVIVHLFKLSIGVAAAAALIFVVMFIFYCRFTPKKALLLLVTPVAFMLHVPYVVPVACALVLGPISAVPVGIWNDHLLYDRMCENFGNSDHQCGWNYQADFAVCEDGIPG